MAGALIASVSSGHGHQTPTGWFLALLILLVLLYVAMRRGMLRRAWNAAGAWRARGALRGVRVRPVALVPTVLLLIVIAVLLIDHR